uniref:Uncharacterized protein n=1 Tax=Lepisosteus oculatus TaxID=7918 RepID=W5MRJ1_LEPOC
YLFKEMVGRSSVLEDELSCPVCCEIFKDPIILTCSHSFCQACLQQYWEQKGSQECPVCRRRSSTKHPPINLALKNLCEAFLEEGHQRSPVNSEVLCRLHSEKLKLFCLTDEEPICFICQTSEKHENHKFCTVQEATQKYKGELKAALEPPQRKLEAFNKVKQKWDQIAEYVNKNTTHRKNEYNKEIKFIRSYLNYKHEAKAQAQQTERQMKDSQMMKEKIESLIREISSLSDTIRTIEQEMEAKANSFLQGIYVSGIQRKQRAELQGPEGVSGALIGVAKQLGSLKYRVWEKMLGNIQYTPVTLDPNTAGPRLSLSEDLTSVTYTAQRQQLPNNPERFDPWQCVLGSEGFTSGKHCWDVEVGDSIYWILSVAKKSINRKGSITLIPEGGLWAIGLWKDVYSALTSPRKLQKIKVQLDYNRGEVSFSDHSDEIPIYAFRNTFTERIFPFF